MFKITSYILVLLVVPVALGQRVELGAGLGLANYRGDITPMPNLKNTTFSTYSRFLYSFNKFLNFRFNVSYTKLKITYGNGLLGNARPAVGYFFSSNLLESQFGLEYYFLNFNTKRPKPRVSPYIHLALGLAAFKTKTPENSSELFIPVERAFNLSYGIGLKYRLSEKLNVATEISTRNSFSDQIDHVANEGTNPDRKDSYYVWSVGIFYRFPSSSCRPFLNGPSPPQYKKRTNKYDRPF